MKSDARRRARVRWKLAERLRAARIARGLTWADVARLAELGAGGGKVVRTWEEGVVMPRTDSLVPLSKVLRVTTDWLLGRTDTGGP
jgi:transcriptional regulator with XRE-family HTH domain